MNTPPYLTPDGQPRKRDAYDEAVEFLIENDQLIYNSWNHPYSTLGGILFIYAAPKKNIIACGCLTQIKKGHMGCSDNEITKQIQADNRLPDNVTAIKREHLPVFAEWQRRLDKHWNRVPPSFVNPPPHFNDNIAIAFPTT